MAIRYNKLWKKLIDENMMKVDLRDQAGITTNALAKLGKNEHVRPVPGGTPGYRYRRSASHHKRWGAGPPSSLTGTSRG